MNLRDIINKIDTIAEAELTPQQQAQNVLQPGMNPANANVQVDDNGNQLITGPDGRTMSMNADGTVYMPGSNPNLPQNKGVVNTVGNWLGNKGEFADPRKTSPWVGTPNTPNVMQPPPEGQDQKPGNYLNVDKNTAAKFILLVNKAEQAKASAPAAGQAGDAVGTTTASTGQSSKPAQNLAPVDPKVQALQKEILAKDPNALPKYGADGRMGTETQTALAKYPDIAAKYKAGATPAAPATSAAPTAGPNGEPIVSRPNPKNPAVQEKGYIVRSGRSQTFVPVAESLQLGLDSALVESFGYQLNEFSTDQAWDVTKAVGKEVAPTLGAGAAVQAGAKMLGKHIPGVNLAFAGKDAYDRAKSGDWTGAGISALSGAAGLIPVIGTAASLGLDAANIARDYKHGEFDALLGKNQQPATPATQATKPAATVPPGGNPKVFALQQQLIAKGAKNKDGTPLVADGKMGPNTQAAMTQFKMAMPQESVAESMADLRSRLDELGGMIGGAAEAGAKAAVHDAGAVAKTAAAVAKEAENGVKFIDKTGQAWEKAGPGQWKAMSNAANKSGYKAGNIVNAQADKAVFQDLEKDFASQGSKSATAAAPAAAAPASTAAADAYMKAEMDLLKASQAGNKEAASALQQIKSMPGGIKAWVKQNPKMAKALAATIPTLAVLAFAGGKEQPPVTPTTTTTTTTTPTTTGQDQKPPVPDENAADMATLKTIYDQLMAAKGEGGGADFEPQLADAIKRYEAMLNGQGGKPTGPVDAKGQKLAYDVGNSRSYTGSSQNPNWSAAAPVKESEDELARWLRIARG